MYIVSSYFFAVCTSSDTYLKYNVSYLHNYFYGRCYNTISSVTGLNCQKYPKKIQKNFYQIEDKKEKKKKGRGGRKKLRIKPKNERNVAYIAEKRSDA